MASRLSRRSLRLCVLAGIGLAGAAMAAETAPAPQRGLAYYDVFADGETVHLLTGYRDTDQAGVALWYRHSTDAGATWSASVRVNADGTGVFAPHPGETPQIAARGAQVLVLWNRFDAEGKPGALVTRFSSDGGAHFQDGANPASDGVEDYHALAELGADAKGFYAVWLHDAKRGGAAPQALYAAASADGLQWRAAERVDAGTCQCCWNRVLAQDGRLGVLYRGGGPRDMRFAWREAGSWRHRVVGEFGWDFQGCPHVGGALVGAGDALHALVWTGKDGQAGLYALRSQNRGKSWSAPQRLGGDAAVHADLAIDGAGTLTAVWDGDDAVESARSQDGGLHWSAAQAVGDGAHRRFPRVVATGQGTLTLWIDGAREDSRLQSSRGPVAPPR